MLLTLVLAAWFYRTAVVAFLILALHAYGEDQTRGQPWLYLYWVMLWFTLLPAPAAVAACRCAISVAYLWSGIQKCNARFFKVIPAWFVEPATHWHLPGATITALRWSFATAPFLELAIGLALWSRRTRRAAIVATVVLHSVALFFLGPLGQNYDFIVWPWNLAMIGLVLVLFARCQPGDAGILPTLTAFRGRPITMAALLLYSLLPVLSFVGCWDSYFSFSLYAENLTTANVFITQAFADRLPPPLRAQVRPWTYYDPQYQAPFLFTYGLWCWHDLGVPFNQEPRIYRALYQYLRTYSREPGDLRMLIGRRNQPVIFLEGDKELLLPSVQQ
jgi:hypothetical protein